MENNRIDKGPTDLSIYDIHVAGDIIAKDQWVWRDSFPYDLIDGIEINLLKPAFPRTEGEIEIINDIAQELKRLSPSKPRYLVEAETIAEDRFDRGQGDSLFG